jgi:hypothetical protein
LEEERAGDGEIDDEKMAGDCGHDITITLVTSDEESEDGSAPLIYGALLKFCFI